MAQTQPTKGAEMTNEENGLGKVIDILIQDARKDEKNKVIEEIEPILKKIWELAYGKTVNYIQLRNDLRAEYKKLNSLKNP